MLPNNPAHVRSANRGASNHLPATGKKPISLSLAGGLCFFLGLALSNVAMADTVDFRDNGSFQTISLTEGAVTATGSNTIQVLGGSGLGIVGSVSNAVLDPGETMTFTFSNPMENIVIASFTPDDTVLNGLNLIADITGYDENGASLGTIQTPIDHTQPIPVSSEFGNVPLSGFDVTMVEDGLRIGSVSFQLVVNAVPEYSCAGYEPPVVYDDTATPDEERLSIAKKSKRVIPFKTEMVMESGDIVTAADIPAEAEPVINIVFSSAADGGGSVDESGLLNNGADDGNQFRYDETDMKWLFLLGTKPYSAAGFYTVFMTSGDPASYTVDQASCTAKFERRP